MTEPYVHQPLRSEISTRILLLEPAAHHGDTLHCCLNEISLKDGDGIQPAYEALSYVWGSPTGDRVVECEGRTILITENCEAALRHLRLKDRIRTLWIDSICIDQKSINERNHQVKIMGEVFERAKKVWIWLGNGDKATTALFRHMRLLNKILKFSQWARLAPKTLATAGHRFVNTDPNPQFIALCKRDWFFRIWTLQEHVLSRRSDVLCGSDSIPWTSFVRCGEYFLSRVKGRETWGYLHHNLILNHLQTNMQSGSYQHPKLLWNGIVLPTLQAARERKSTDPRDRIFALYRIFQSIGITTIEPDYGLPTTSLYVLVAIMSIWATRSLPVLGHVLSRQRMPDLPSWVPDWSEPPVQLARIPYAASRKPQVDLDMLKPSALPKLPLRGKLYAKVNSLGARMPTQLDLESIKCYLSWHLLALQFDSYPTGQAVLTAFGQTLLMSYQSEAIDLDEKLRDLKLWSKVLIASETPSSRKSFAITAHANEMESIEPSLFVGRCLARQKPLEKLTRTFHYKVNGGIFFTTSTGRMGISLGNIEPGDLIVLFAGAEEPIIIRPVGENYEFVAVAYVHAVNWDEILPEEASIEDLEKFVLI